MNRPNYSLPVTAGGLSEFNASKADRAQHRIIAAHIFISDHDDIGISSKLAHLTHTALHLKAKLCDSFVR